MYTVGPTRRTLSGQTVVQVVDEKLRYMWVYVPFSNSTDEGITQLIGHIMSTRRGTPPPEDFTRGR